MFTDEQDIDRQLTAELSVAPSAGFEAGVRRRVAAEAPPRNWRVPVWFAAAAAVLAAFGAWYLAGRPEPAQVGKTPAIASSDRLLPVPVPPSGPSIESPRPGPISASPRPRPARIARVPEPEVLVPPGQLEAIRRLVAAADAGRLLIPDPDGAPAGPLQLEVPRLTVDPIPLVGVEPGGGSRPGAKGLQ